MNKKVLSLAITMAMAFPTASHALGLGDIQSNSHLNQPFKGTIQVLSATPEEARSIRVRLASPEVFNRVGIDRPAFLNSIRFTPSVQRGKPVILVSSSQPIHEPFVNFLLEVNWSKGQLLKEYTALLDPPVLMQPGQAIASNQVGVRAEPNSGRINRPVAQRQQPQVRRQAQRRVVRNAPARRLTEFQRGAQALGALSNTRAVRASGRTKTYRVKRGDYLYKVAKKLGYRGVRTEQMMMALFEANPKAFHKNNVNNLKSGAVMQRPSAQQAKRVSYRSAKSQLASHTASWKSGRSQVASGGKSSANTSTSAQSGLQGGQSAASLARENARKAPDNKLTVSGSNGAKVTDLSVAGNATAAELKQKLALASESLAARSNENAELKSRVSELESLLRKKNRLITLKSEQLADFQARAGGAEVSATTEPVTEVVEPQDPIDEMGGENEGTGIQAAISDQNPGEIIRSAPPIEQTVEVEPPVEDTSSSVAATTPSETESDGGILGLLDNPLVQGIGGGSLLALLGGLWYMKRRKDGVDLEDGEGFEDFDLDQELSQNTDFEQDADVTAGDDFTTADFGTEKNMFADPQQQEEETKDSDLSVESSGESKEENVLQEADVYLVYGLHDQAEAELRKAIEEEPDNLHYRAKLIENFKAAGDKEGFEKEVKIFKDLEGDDKDKLWQDISQWGKTMIPDSNIFSGSSSSESGMSGKGVAGAAIAGAAAAGLAVTAGEASPEEVATFDTDLDETLASNELEGLDLDAVLDDDLATLDTNDLDLGTLDTDTNDLLGDDFVVSDDLADSKLLDEGLDSTALDIDLGLNDSLDKGLDTTSLNLDIDSDGFDKIMPEDHAYKKADEVVDDITVDAGTAKADVEDNLLADFDDNLSFLDLEDEGEVIEETQIGAKIDLAKAYIDMGDIEGARSTLEEVMMEGNDEQKKVAEELLHQTG